MGTQAQIQNSYTFDALTQLHDGASIVSGQGQLAAANQELDFGNLSPGTLVENVAYTRFDMIIDVTAFDFTTGDEVMTFTLQLGDTSGFGAGVIVNRVSVPFGAAGGIAGSGADDDSALGRVVVGADNFHKGTLFRFARLFVTSAGTTPSASALVWLGDLR